MRKSIQFILILFLFNSCIDNQKKNVSESIVEQNIIVSKIEGLKTNSNE